MAQHLPLESLKSPITGKWKRASSFSRTEGGSSRLVAKDLPIPGEHSPLHWQYSSEVPPSAYFNADAWAMPHPTAIRSALEELADGAGGLADAVFVFHQGEAHVAFAEGAKPNPGRDGNRRLLQDEFRELQGADGAVFFGDRGPKKHRAARTFHRPTGAVQAGDQDVAALLVDGADFLGVLFALAEGDDAGDLDGLENAVVQLALDARHGGDQFRNAQAETHPPAGHVIALGHRENLHGHILGALHLQNAGWLVAVEAEVGVSEIVDDEGAVVARQTDDLAEVIQIDAGRGGVVREGDEEHLRLHREPAIDVFQPIEEGGGIGHGEHARLAFGHEHAVLGNRIGGVGRDHDVAGTDGGEEEVRERILGADGDDGFLLGVERHAVIGLVAAGDLFAQSGDAARLRVAMIARIACGFDQLVDDGARRSAIGVPHAEIDDVDLRGARLGAHLIDHGEDVGGKLLYAVKLV